jgi:hypothetical protein
MKWESVVNLEQSLGTCHNDLVGDWYRDPWGWPELDWLVSTRPDLVFQRLNGDGTRAVAIIDVPKENYGIRPAMILDPVDRLAYQAIVGSLSLTLIGGLSPAVYGWRLPVRSPKAGVYSPNNLQWDNYRGRLGALSALYDVVLKTDIVSCFASFSVESVCEVLASRVTRSGNQSVATARLASFLKGWDRVSSRSGIPQRCQASSVLANMMLGAIDDVLGYHTKPPVLGTNNGPSFVRWMDDIWLFGTDPGELRRAQVDIYEALRRMGLHINTGKTKLLEGDAVVEHARDIEHSAVDAALAREPVSTVELDGLIERIVAEREEANRTSIRFATERMRKHHHFVKVDELVAVAERLPHGADALARLFRDAGRTDELEDWFLEYCHKPWAKLEWAVAQFGTMFPSSRPAGRRLSDHLLEVVAEGKSSLPLAALAVQRAARWDKARARVAIDEAIRKADNPLQRRALALAGLNAGHTNSAVAKWLGEFEENAVTLEMLKDQGFPRTPFKPDFAGS